MLAGRLLTGVGAKAREDGRMEKSNMPVAALSPQKQGSVFNQYLIFIPFTVSSDMHFSKL